MWLSLSRPWLAATLCPLARHACASAIYWHQWECAAFNRHRDIFIVIECAGILVKFRANAWSEMAQVWWFWCFSSQKFVIPLLLDRKGLIIWNPGVIGLNRSEGQSAISWHQVGLHARAWSTFRQKDFAALSFSEITQKFQGTTLNLLICTGIFIPLRRSSEMCINLIQLAYDLMSCFALKGDPSVSSQ